MVSGNSWYKSVIEIFLREYDGSVLVNKHLAFNVLFNSAAQHNFLQVSTFGNERLDIVFVGNAHDVLFDDRAGVEFRSHIVAGRADNLDPAVKGLVIGLGPHECRQEGVVDIDNPLGISLDKVFADDTGHVDHFKNFDKFRYYAEVSDVVNGRSVGRENDKERILAYNIGVSIHDINYAAHIYQMISERPESFEKLIDANMGDPTEKFWV